MGGGASIPDPRPKWGVLGTPASLSPPSGPAHHDPPPSRGPGAAPPLHTPARTALRTPALTPPRPSPCPGATLRAPRGWGLRWGRRGGPGPPPPLPAGPAEPRRRTKERAPGTAAPSPRPVQCAGGPPPGCSGDGKGMEGKGKRKGRRAGQAARQGGEGRGEAGAHAASAGLAAGREARHCAPTHFLFTDPLPSPRSTGGHLLGARAGAVGAG